MCELLDRVAQKQQQIDNLRNQLASSSTLSSSFPSSSFPSSSILSPSSGASPMDLTVVGKFHFILFYLFYFILFILFCFILFYFILFFILPIRLRLSKHYLQTG